VLAGDISHPPASICAGGRHTFLAMLLTWSLLPISSTCMPHRSIDRRRALVNSARGWISRSIDRSISIRGLFRSVSCVHGWIFYDLPDVHRLGVELASAVSIHLTTHVPPSLATTLRSLDQHQVDDDVKMHGSIWYIQVLDSIEMRRAHIGPIILFGDPF
jgi:hypothetical protein